MIECILIIMRKSEVNLCELTDFWKNYENILRKHWIFKLLNLRHSIEISEKF